MGRLSTLALMGNVVLHEIEAILQAGDANQNLVFDQLDIVQVQQAGEYLTGDDADNNIFKATFGSSFASLSFGAVAQPGLSEDFLSNDLTVVGSLAGGGDLGDVDLTYVPEPSTVLLLVVGLIPVVTRRRPV